MRNLAIICSIVLFITSCSKEDLTPNSNKSVTYTNVEFGSDSRQMMDIFLPAGRTVNTTKTIVVIHGGAWTSGDKSEMTEVVDSLKRRLPNYAFINLNYRLAVNNSVNVFPAQENDEKTAIEF